MNSAVLQQLLLNSFILIPIITIIISIKSVLKHETAKVLAVLFIFIFLESIISSILAIRGVNNMLVINLYTLIQFVVLSYFFILLLDKKNKSGYYVFSGIIVIGLILEYMFFCNMSFNNISALITNLIFILACLAFFIKLFREEKVLSLLDYPDFYFVSGLIITFGGGIFILAFSNYALSISNQAAKVIWHFNSLLNIISYIVVSIGFYKCRKLVK